MEIEGYLKIGDKYYKNEDVQMVLNTRIPSYTKEEAEEPEGEGEEE